MTAFLITSTPELRKTPVLSNLGEQNSQVTIQDKTVSSRIGFRGPGAEAFLVSQDIMTPEQPNQALRMASGLLVMRLSKTEFWLLDLTDQHTQMFVNLELKALKQEQVYRLYCQHSHSMFQVTGDATAQMFAKLCGVDLSHAVFTTGCIAQTSVARVNAIVVNVSLSDTQSNEYLLLSDVSSSQHLWDALLDAAQEF